MTILRVRSTAYDRSHLPGRALNYLSYVLGLVWKAMLSQRPDARRLHDRPAVHRRRSPVVVARALPGAAARGHAGRLPRDRGQARPAREPGRRRAAAAADRPVAACSRPGGRDRRDDEAAGRGERRLARAHPRDPELGRRRERRRRGRTTTSWARRHGLGESFVVMHSGNIGHAQNLDALSAPHVPARPRRPRRRDHRLRRAPGRARRAGRACSRRTRCEFLAYQERSILSQSLSTADVHVVGLARGLAGYVVPSRLYGILAAGRPVIAATDAESETAQLVTEVGCGVVVPPGNPFALAAAIRAAHDGDYDLEAMGRRARGVRGARGRPRRSPCGATETCSPSSRRPVLAVEVVFWASLGRARLDARRLPARSRGGRPRAATARPAPATCSRA